MYDRIVSARPNDIDELAVLMLDTDPTDFAEYVRKASTEASDDGKANMTRMLLYNDGGDCYPYWAMLEDLNCSKAHTAAAMLISETINRNNGNGGPDYSETVTPLLRARFDSHMMSADEATAYYMGCSDSAYAPMQELCAEISERFGLNGATHKKTTTTATGT